MRRQVPALYLSTTLFSSSTGTSCIRPVLLFFYPQARQSIPTSARLQCRTLVNTTPLLSKKGGKQDTKRNVAQAITTSEAAANDPYDFSTLQEDIARAVQRLRDEVAKVRTSGKVGVESVGALRVTLKNAAGGAAGGEGGSRGDKGKGRGKRGGVEKEGSAGQETVKLEELAQVLQRGRMVVLIVGEAEHIKPITTALLSSRYSLNPTPSPHNPLELHIPIPPPTAESRKQVLDATAKCGEGAGNAVRQARSTQQKKLRAMTLARTARPDDIRKAGEKMEKVVEGGNKEVKDIVEQAKRALERG